MRRGPIHHPIQTILDEIWDAGHTPRLQIDARREDVVVPEFVKARWGAALVLDLDAAWPLHLETTKEALSVDLAFQGTVTRCVLPWASIDVVIDRTTGRGVRFDPREQPPAAPAEATAPRTTLKAVAPPDEASSGRSEAGSADDDAGGQGASPAVAEVSPGGPDAAPPGQGADDEARKRRARFKVIDGGR